LVIPGRQLRLTARADTLSIWRRQGKTRAQTSLSS
jgi:hypothetical protein